MKTPLSSFDVTYKPSLSSIESSLTSLHINNVVFKTVEEQAENISLVVHTFVHTV